MHRRALLSLLLFFMSGCTTLSPGDCIHADWYQTGYLAGASGKPPSDSLKFQSACAHYGIATDRRAFAEGWVAGATTGD